MDASHPPSYGMSDSVAVLRHHWWLLVLGTVLGLTAGGTWLQLADPVWESTTSVLVHPAGLDANVAGGRTQGQVNLDTEAQLVRSTAVATGAAGGLGEAVAPDELAEQVSVKVPPNTSVLAITFAGPTPELAQAGSAAFAEAYLAHREQSARTALFDQMEAIEAKVEELEAALTEVDERLATTQPGDPAETNLDSQRSAVADQLSTMSGRLNELATATVTPGEVISEGQVPTEPVGPDAAIVVASGVALGLVGGVAAAGAAERLTRRLRRPSDLVRRVGLPVLATLSDRRGQAAPPGSEILSPYGVTGRMIDRLRNEVLASTQGKVIMVTSARNGAGSSFVAGNLAVSLARAGHDVIMVGARVPDNVAAANPLSRLLGVAATPGLSEALAGRVTAEEALQQAPRHPRLRAMTMGGTASATGLLQQPTLREVLRALADRTEYVVVDAPPTGTSADTQSLAGYADVALLVAEPRKSKLAEIADAADQLRRVGTPLLGAVVVPPQRAEPTEASTTPDTGTLPEQVPYARGTASAPVPTDSDLGTDHAITPAADAEALSYPPAGPPAQRQAEASTGETDDDAPVAPDGDDTSPQEPERPPRSGPPRPTRSGPHLPVLGNGGWDRETVVMPQLDDEALAALDVAQSPTEAG